MTFRMILPPSGEPKPGPAVKLDEFWDRSQGLWCVRALDAQGNQIGDATWGSRSRLPAMRLCLRQREGMS